MPIRCLICCVYSKFKDDFSCTFKNRTDITLNLVCQQKGAPKDGIESKKYGPSVYWLRQETCAVGDRCSSSSLDLHKLPLSTPISGLTASSLEDSRSPFDSVSCSRHAQVSRSSMSLPSGWRGYRPKQNISEHPTKTAIPAKYYGYDHCYYKAGDMNVYCQQIVSRFLHNRKGVKSSNGKHTGVTITVDHNGVQMQFGGGEATVQVPVKDIACMSLCPKRTSGASASVTYDADCTAQRIPHFLSLEPSFVARLPNEASPARPRLQSESSI
eukprot:m.137473 g.137473  ORF g.137473 m.137473 type:complete len:270 (-) comp13974_c0_seq4:1872-2681(-)